MLVVLLAAAGCGQSGSKQERPGTDGADGGRGPQTGGGSAGASGQSGGASSGAGGDAGGAAGSAGATSGSGTSGSTSAGGASGSAGAGGASGSAGAGEAGGSAGGGEAGGGGNAGAAPGGSSGSSGSGGAGPTTLVPSPGCDLANAEPITRLGGFDGETRVRLPNGYDGSTPRPVLFGFHETAVARQIELELPASHVVTQSYVVVAPRTDVVPGGFENRTITDFRPLVDEVLATFCVDRNAIFAVGHASGGRYVAKLLSGGAISGTPRPEGGGDQFRAAAIIGAYAGGARWPPVPLLFVHGENAGESASITGDADGAAALSRFVANNGCDMTSVPVDFPGCESEGQTVNPGCVDLDGCTEPLRFCRHDDPTGYQLNSGWPCFATDAMYEFFEAHRR